MPQPLSLGVARTRTPGYSWWKADKGAGGSIRPGTEFGRDCQLATDLRMEADDGVPSLPVKVDDFESAPPAS
jgi:hypothetical protein